jgi:predicted transcriptional regulator
VAEAPERQPPLLSMRLDDRTRERLDRLADHLGLNRSNVVRLAVQRLYQAEGLEALDREQERRRDDLGGAAA